MPLDDSGTNQIGNLILIKDIPEHRAVHDAYNPSEQLVKLIEVEQSVIVAYPVPPNHCYIYPDGTDGNRFEEISEDKFAEIFSCLPDDYLDLMRLTNGLDNNGVTVAAISPIGRNAQTIAEATREMRALLGRHAIFFGAIDDTYLIFDQETGTFSNIEAAGGRSFDDFDSCEVMLLKALFEMVPHD